MDITDYIALAATLLLLVILGLAPDFDGPLGSDEDTAHHEDDE